MDGLYKCHPGYLPCPAPLRQAFSVIMSDCLPILTDFISHVYLGNLGKLIHPYPVQPPQILPELQACLLAPHWDCTMVSQPVSLIPPDQVALVTQAVAST